MSPDERSPRISPGSRRDIGLIADGITRLLGVATGAAPPNLFTTLARHRKLFRPWLRFAGKLMPGGTLARTDTELVILRVAASMDCAYEWRHHERLGAEAGLSAEDIQLVARTGHTDLWDPRRAALLRAVDELGHIGVIGDPTWDTLLSYYTESDLIELCLLVGHYEMLAKTINTLRIQPDEPPTRPVPAVIRRVEKLMSTRPNRQHQHHPVQRTNP